MVKVLEYPEGRIVNFTAGANITAGQLVEVTGDKTVSPAAADSKAVVGVALADANAGDPVPVVTRGFAWVTAAAAVTAGGLVKAAANGQITAYASGTDPADAVVGVVVVGASAGSQALIMLKV